ncbi:uncharacterized protein LOC124633110 [Helicoverpa zea]|uniref:uncharacterized protein LOC124630942 n=2 Tax=Helicoverpa zea TaxID=7113 RepID=UPI001F55E554|nr:uncharacterized protein LOC124630942 [Helicoverpa zea]XP_047024163.1 uncharacterized protein LOC124633110 [Helicoverpa zea]
MDKDLRILEDIKTQIEKGLINFKKSPKDRIDQHYVETRQQMLERLFTTFSSKYEAMVGDYGSGKIANYFQGDVFEATSETYLCYQVQLKKTMSTFNTIKCKSSGEGSSDNSRPSVTKLPKIQIPIFSGKYTEWTSFRELFISLIHNNSMLDDVQRLHYLKTQLSGEAEQLIRHVPVTQANYKICWDMIESRYNNKKYISNCILQRLFNQKAVNVDSSSALKGLLDVTNDCLHQLSNLGINVKTWDVIVIYIISLKLDVESRKQWELQVNQSSSVDFPSWLQFQEFLETRFRALEFIQPTGKPKVLYSYTTSHPKEVNDVTKMSCPHCAETHRLFNCKKFCKEEVEQRRNIAQSLGLCFNCLGKNHTTKVCKSLTTCRFCQRKHHTLLHLRNYSIPSTDAGSSEPTPQQTTNLATHLLKGIAPGRVLLATALIRAESKDGSTQVLRALLDQGSQASFITEAAAQLLRLKRIGSKTKIAGIGGNQSGVSVVSNYTDAWRKSAPSQPEIVITLFIFLIMLWLEKISWLLKQGWPMIHRSREQM